MTNIKFRRVSNFERGLLLELLKDAYAFDNRYEQRWITDWHEFDNFFFDNLDIADKYGFITTLNDKAIGFVSWDPRKIPEYAEIGHNCIAMKHKGYGYGVVQLQEAVNRIKQTDLRKIIVTTNANLVPAQRMYESVGFKVSQKREINGDTDFAGKFIDYEYPIY